MKTFSVFIVKTKRQFFPNLMSLIANPCPVKKDLFFITIICDKSILLQWAPTFSGLGVRLPLLVSQV